MSDPSLRSSTGPIDGSAVSRSTALIITALVLAECLSAFEAGMIFIALPRFSEIFEAPASTTGWAVTAYMLVAATTALVGGRLGDMYGRKKVLILAMLVSTLGSVISVFGVSPMYFNARSMPSRLTGSFSASGSGTLPPIAVTISGEVPQVTCGSICSARSSTTRSKCAPGSDRKLRHDAAA